MSFDSFRNILSQNLQKSALKKEFQIARVFDAFNAVLLSLWGEERAKFVTPVSFQEGVLKIATTSSVARQQFMMDQARLKNELNRKLGSLVVRSISVTSKGF
jgi:hypothetical protein